MCAARKTIELKRVVVTGVGVVSPVGMGKASFMESLLAGRSGVKLITRFDTTEYSVKFAAELTDSTRRIIDEEDRQAARPVRPVWGCGRHAGARRLGLSRR